MIFNIVGHIDMIRNGLLPPPPTKRYGTQYLPIKTQTRRLNRGIYKVGKDYAVQRKRGVKAEPDIRIVMDRIWEDFDFISVENAHLEGGYLPRDFEEVFEKLNPTWHSGSRWAFEFHVIEIWVKEEKELYRKFDEAQRELDKGM